ncbi:MAG: replicative DNA helicase [Clostridia bacterium]|nr:replicative DNA helicase [Clostridia bacterium]MBQ1967921.1 replicative DNA helicase [Clostridia bacterium]MBQ1995870.1 replicative DNA helicase [Clostridia bacterium]
MDGVNTFASIDEVNMPYSLEAEQAVLGSILLDPACITQVNLLVKPEYFYLPQHRAIFTIMQEMDALGSKIDPLLILEKLKSSKVYDDASGKQYLLTLSQIVPSTENVEAYSKIIREKYYIRSLINVSKDIISDATTSSEPADSLLEVAEQKIYDIRQGRVTKGPSKIGDIIVNEVYDKLQKLSSADKDKYKGFTTGFTDLDKAITGLNRSDLLIIGARPAMGKTSLALNLARNTAMMGKKKVLFFSLEMTKEQLAQRVLSTEARVESTKMRTGDISGQEWANLATATALLSNCELYFDDTSNMTVSEMKSRIRRLRDVDAVFVDYLQLMKSGSRVESRVQEVSEITRNLKLMAKDLNIPVVVLAQLARSTEGRGKSHRPQLADLRESGSIEQDADIVIMLYRDEYYATEKDDAAPDEDRPAVNEAEFIIAKNRHGPTTTVKVAWNGDYTMFTNLETIRNDM